MRKSKHLPRLCWDANCFIALLDKNVGAPSNELDALIQAYHAMLDKQLQIISSSFVRTELLQNDALQFINELENHPCFHLVATTPAVELKVRDIRILCKSHRDAGNLIHIPKSADAHYIAAAILGQADELWTLDGRILNLSAVITEVVICAPNLRHVQQLRLDWGAP